MLVAVVEDDDVEVPELVFPLLLWLRLEENIAAAVASPNIERRVWSRTNSTGRRTTSSQGRQRLQSAGMSPW